jgi:hypothetical protein
MSLLTSTIKFSLISFLFYCIRVIFIKFQYSMSNAFCILFKFFLIFCHSDDWFILQIDASLVYNPLYRFSFSFSFIDYYIRIGCYQKRTGHIRRWDFFPRGPLSLSTFPRFVPEIFWKTGKGLVKKSKVLGFRFP